MFGMTIHAACLWESPLPSMRFSSVPNPKVLCRLISGTASGAGSFGLLSAASFCTVVLGGSRFVHHVDNLPPSYRKVSNLKFN